MSDVSNKIYEIEKTQIDSIINKILKKLNEIRGE